MSRSIKKMIWSQEYFPRIEKENWNKDRPTDDSYRFQEKRKQATSQRETPRGRIPEVKSRD